MIPPSLSSLAIQSLVRLFSSPSSPSAVILYARFADFVLSTVLGTNFSISNLFYRSYSPGHASTAKRAYLQTLITPPPQFTSPTSDIPFVLKPYDGPDAQSIISSVNQRAAAQGGGHRTRPSLVTNTSGGNGNGHAKRQSTVWKNKSQAGDTIGVPAEPLAREPSPTLPSLPNHPTLGSLISSAHPDLSGNAEALVSS